MLSLASLQAGRSNASLAADSIKAATSTVSRRGSQPTITAMFPAAPTTSPAVPAVPAAPAPSSAAAATSSEDADVPVTAGIASKVLPSGMTSYDFYEFDPKAMQRHCVCLVLGDAAAANTAVIVSLLQAWNFRRSFVVLGKAESAEYYESHDVPGGYIYTPEQSADETKAGHFPAAELVNFRQDQANRVSAAKLDPSNNNPEAAVVISDWYHLHSVTHSEALLQMTSHVMSLHYALVLDAVYAYNYPPEIRRAVNYVFLTSQSTEENIKRIHQMYFSRSTSLAHFRHILDQAQLAKRIIVADLVNHVVGHMSVNAVPGNIKIGDPAWRKISEDHFMDPKKQFQLTWIRRQNFLAQQELARLQQLSTKLRCAPAYDVQTRQGCLNEWESNRPTLPAVADVEKKLPLFYQPVQQQVPYPYPAQQLPAQMPGLFNSYR